MEKSAVTDYFLKYFEKNRIDVEWISEKTGIKQGKLCKDYKVPFTAEEFFQLCMLLELEPEEIIHSIKEKEHE